MHDKEVSSSGSGSFWKKMFGLGTVIAIVAALYWQFGHYLKLDYLAQRETDLKALQAQSPLLVIGIAFLVYVALTGLSLPGAALLTLAFGWYFGFWQGLGIVSFASVTGATVAFLISRYFLRDALQNRFGTRLQTFNKSLDQEGGFYLFTLRLIPAVPFFVINAVMGLTKLRTWTFWWVSQLGMLPGTIVYVYAGSRVPNLKTLSDQGIKAVFSASQLTQLFIAFGLLGLFPLLVKWTMRKWLPTPTERREP